MSTNIAIWLWYAYKNAHLDFIQEPVLPQLCMPFLAQNRPKIQFEIFKLENLHFYCTELQE